MCLKDQAQERSTLKPLDNCQNIRSENLLKTASNLDEIHKNLNDLCNTKINLLNSNIRNSVERTTIGSKCDNLPEFQLSHAR